MIRVVRRCRRLGLLAIALTAAAALPAPAIAAPASPYPAEAVGSDVSYPQCDPTTPSVAGTPPDGQFGIVGVTDGKPWVANPCLASEWSEAAALPDAPGLYMNTADPAPRSSYYWPTSGAMDPKSCIDAQSVSDPGCSYDYGWHAAADALSKAEAVGIADASTVTWWLDVETDNTWNGTQPANVADLQGSADYLRGHGVPTVGIYTSAANWESVTGGYDGATASSYEAAWKAEFTPAHPLRFSPVWKLGTGSHADAARSCATISPTGARVWLAQYDGESEDADLACPTIANSSFAVKARPPKATLHRTHHTSLKIAIKESGPTQSVRLHLAKPTKGVNAKLAHKTVSKSGTVSLHVSASAARIARGGTVRLRLTATGVTATRSTTIPLKLRP